MTTFEEYYNYLYFSQIQSLLNTKDPQYQSLTLSELLTPFHESMFIFVSTYAYVNHNQQDREAIRGIMQKRSERDQFHWKDCQLLPSIVNKQSNNSLLSTVKKNTKEFLCKLFNIDMYNSSNRETIQYHMALSSFFFEPIQAYLFFSF